MPNASFLRVPLAGPSPGARRDERRRRKSRANHACCKIWRRGMLLPSLNSHDRGHRGGIRDRACDGPPRPLCIPGGGLYFAGVAFVAPGRGHSRSSVGTIGHGILRRILCQRRTKECDCPIGHLLSCTGPIDRSRLDAWHRSIGRNWRPAAGGRPAWLSSHRGIAFLCRCRPNASCRNSSGRSWCNARCGFEVTALSYRFHAQHDCGAAARSHPGLQVPCSPWC